MLKHPFARHFAPFSDLADRLLPHLGEPGTDGSHDLSHILRVWRNASAIARHEPECDPELLLVAVVLHDCVAVEKSNPSRPLASRLAAEQARRIMAGLGWDEARLVRLGHAIESHSFSARIAPTSVDAFILQDADRLDAIGAIGIARCFYTGGRMGSALYDPADILAARRPLDDRQYALDHFPAKLFPVAEGFRTETGRRMAQDRLAFMKAFVAAFHAEASANPVASADS